TSPPSRSTCASRAPRCRRGRTFPASSPRCAAARRHDRIDAQPAHPPKPRLRRAHRMTTTFTLNGKPMSAEVPDDTPLLWVIRETANLTGTKFGCGIGMCGACTVHVEGRATRSCITPVTLVDGAAITTIEG